MYGCDDESMGAGVRLFGVQHGATSGFCELMSQGITHTSSNLAFAMRTYEVYAPYDRLIITRQGYTGIGDNFDPSTININDRLTIDHTLALVSQSDIDLRYIRARSTAGGLNIMAGSEPSDGAGIELFARNNTGVSAAGSAPNTPAGITFTASDYTPSQLDVAYKFQHLTYSSGVHFRSFTIDKLGRGRFGPGPSFYEKLQVDGNIHLYDAADGYRGVKGYASTGGIDLCAGAAASDGSMIRLYAQNNVSNAGRIFISSRASSGKAITLGTTNSSGTSTDGVVMDANGKVHLSNDLDFSLLSTSTPAVIRGPSGNLHLYSQTNDQDGTGIHLLNSITTFVSGFGAVPTGTIYTFQKYVGGTTPYAPLMSIHNDGKVVIGDNNTLAAPGAYKLYVEDGILTEKVHVAVKTTTAWSDFVFADDYKLRQLSEVSAFIKKNKHLPNVPSAQEVVQNGIDIAEMDAKLLQKVEELTLYVIELEKKVKALEVKQK